MTTPEVSSLSSWHQEWDQIVLHFLSTTHPRCHSLLLGKASGVLAARALFHWSCQEHRSCQCHTGHSNSCQWVRDYLWNGHRSSPGLQGECTVVQEWEELGKGKRTLGKRFSPCLQTGQRCSLTRLKCENLKVLSALKSLTKSMGLQSLIRVWWTRSPEISATMNISAQWSTVVFWNTQKRNTLQIKLSKGNRAAPWRVA